MLASSKAGPSELCRSPEANHHRMVGMVEAATEITYTKQQSNNNTKSPMPARQLHNDIHIQWEWSRGPRSSRRHRLCAARYITHILHIAADELMPAAVRIRPRRLRRSGAGIFASSQVVNNNKPIISVLDLMR